MAHGLESTSLPTVTSIIRLLITVLLVSRLALVCFELMFQKSRETPTRVKVFPIYNDPDDKRRNSVWEFDREMMVTNRDYLQCGSYILLDFFAASGLVSEGVKSNFRTLWANDISEKKAVSA